MEENYVTRGELDAKITSLGGDIKDHLAQTIKQLKEDIVDVKKDLETVENRAKDDIQRLNDRLDNKLSVIDDKMGSNYTLLGEIKSILKAREKEMEGIQTQQELIRKDHSKQAVDYAVLVNQYKTIYDDVYGSPTKPDTISLFSTLKEINAKISDVITMAAFHGKEIQRIESEIKRYENIVETFAIYLKKVSSFMLSKTGVGAGIAFGLLVLALSESKEIPAIIELLVNALSQ